MNDLYLCVNLISHVPADSSGGADNILRGELRESSFQHHEELPVHGCQPAALQTGTKQLSARVRGLAAVMRLRVSELSRTCVEFLLSAGLNRYDPTPSKDTFVS